MRLDIPAATAVRFEPGDVKPVTLVEFGGDGDLFGMNGLVQGNYRESGALEAALEKARGLGFRGGRLNYINRGTYVSLYGPTSGDRVRLADTNLVVRIEEDFAVYGEEAAFGGGESIRDGMEQSATVLSRDGAPDTVITNVIVIDPVLGVLKADIGIKNGRIVAVGQSGDPDVMDNITPGLVIGASTAIIAGEHMIATPGGVDTHIHMIAPQRAWEALSNGITTLIGGGTGPCGWHARDDMHAGAMGIAQMLRAADPFR